MTSHKTNAWTWRINDEKKEGESKREWERDEKKQGEGMVEF